jgi:hypothetical protein
VHEVNIHAFYSAGDGDKYTFKVFKKSIELVVSLFQTTCTDQMLCVLCSGQERYQDFILCVE